MILLPYLHDDFNQPETDAEYCLLPSHREGGIATVKQLLLVASEKNPYNI